MRGHANNISVRVPGGLLKIQSWLHRIKYPYSTYIGISTDPSYVVILRHIWGHAGIQWKFRHQLQQIIFHVSTKKNPGTVWNKYIFLQYDMDIYFIYLAYSEKMHYTLQV